MMEKLVPVILCDYFNANLWKMLSGHSYFYKQICAKEVGDGIKVGEVPVPVCNMENVFLLEFMNVMHHFLVHLPWETFIGGHAQFSWMYS
jgi:hypothetical protein